MWRLTFDATAPCAAAYARLRAQFGAEVVSMPADFTIDVRSGAVPPSQPGQTGLFIVSATGRTREVIRAAA